MFKYAFVFLLGLLVFQKATAQTERDTLVYFMKNTGKVVDTKDSADYVMFNMPADTSTGAKLYPVFEFYKNGVRKLSGVTQTRSYKLIFEGTCLNFFKNGHRKNIITYNNGNPLNIVEYYQNGKLYTSKKYSSGDHIVVIDKNISFEKNSLLEECRDSTGKVLAENGNGTWMKFDDDVKNMIGEGPVTDGLEEGEWHGTHDDTIKYIYAYAKGKIISGTSFDKSGKAYPFTQAEIEPTFKGGIQEFYVFLSRTVRYPDVDRRASVTGKAFIQFVIEKDGRLTNAKVLRAPSATLGAEALRSVKLSPPWLPGYQCGLPVRVQYTVPINFTLNGPMHN